MARTVRWSRGFGRAVAGALVGFGALGMTAAELMAHGPGTHGPKTQVPTSQVPEIKVPEIQVPEIKVSEIKVHEIHVTDTGGSDVRGSDANGSAAHGTDEYGSDFHRSDAHGTEKRGPSSDSVDSAQTYKGELERVDQEIAFLTRISEEQPGTWKPLEGLAGLYQERARLTGSLDDLAKADQLVDEAFDLAAPGAGPFHLRAALDFSLHRFDRVEDSLRKAEQKVILSQPERSAIDGLRADLMLQFGEPETSLRHLGWTPPASGDVSGLTLEVDPDVDYVRLSRLATIAWMSGQFEAADRLFVMAADLHHGPRAWPRAWIHLHRGVLDLDRGRLDEALSHYADASAELSGWWLVDEHVAEVYRLQGRAAEAEAIYRDVVERTGHPEFMGALAELALAEGRKAEYEEWATKADLVYEAQLAATPEAAWGHAFDHYFEVRRDLERALQLATWDFRLRPNAETKERLARVRAALSSLGEGVPSDPSRG